MVCMVLSVSFLLGLSTWTWASVHGLDNHSSFFSSLSLLERYIKRGVVDKKLINLVFILHNIL